MRIPEGHEPPDEHPPAHNEAPDLADAEPVNPPILGREPAEAAKSVPPPELGPAAGVVAIKAYGETQETPPTASALFRQMTDKAFVAQERYIDTDFVDGRAVTALQLELEGSPIGRLDVTIKKSNVGTEIICTHDDLDAPVAGMKKRTFSYAVGEDSVVRYYEGDGEGDATTRREVRYLENAVSQALPKRVYASDIIAPTPDAPFERPENAELAERDTIIEAGLAAQLLEDLVRTTLIKESLDLRRPYETHRGTITEEDDNGAATATTTYAVGQYAMRSGETQQLGCRAIIRLETIGSVEEYIATTTASLSAAVAERRIDVGRIANLDAVTTHQEIEFRILGGLLSKVLRTQYVGHEGDDSHLLETTQESSVLADRADAQRIRNFLHRPGGRRP